MNLNNNDLQYKNKYFQIKQKIIYGGDINIFKLLKMKEICRSYFLNKNHDIIYQRNNENKMLELANFTYKYDTYYECFRNNTKLSIDELFTKCNVDEENKDCIIPKYKSEPEPDPKPIIVYSRDSNKMGNTDRYNLGFIILKTLF